MAKKLVTKNFSRGLEGLVFKGLLPASEDPKDCAPVQEDPNRWVHFTDQTWIFDEGTFCEPGDVHRKRGLEILQE